MHSGMNAIQYMGMLMSQQSVQIPIILELVEILNGSYFQCQRVVTILSEVFEKQKSGKILLAVEILEYLIKNANKNFHQAANKSSFQKRLLGLLKRVRGKSSFLRDLRSNTDNWNKIEAKVLYLVQLWYDAFILEESVYNNIIETYKVLRKENILFPPRSINEKNLLFVQTESPIFENIEDISRRDHQKFGQTLQSMGLQKANHKIQVVEQQEQRQRFTRKIDLDEISERIAIVRSNGCQGRDMLKLIQQIKKDLEHGKVDPSEEKYWKDIKEAAESVIEDWEETNAQLIKQYEREFLEAKLGKMSIKREQKESLIPENSENQTGVVFERSEKEARICGSEKGKSGVRRQPAQEINLLDL